MLYFFHTPLVVPPMKNIFIKHTVITVLVVSGWTAANEIYYHEDANGVIHFSDELSDPSLEKAYEANEGTLIEPNEETTFLKRSTRWRHNHEKFKTIIHSMSRLHDVEPALVEAVILTESAYNPNAVSRKGARGLMQLMPATAKSYGVKNLHDPRENISGGIRLLRDLIDKYNGNLDLALAAYNAGETAVEKYRGIPPYAETIDYVAKVRKYYSQFAGSQNYIVAEQDSI